MNPTSDINPAASITVQSVKSRQEFDQIIETERNAGEIVVLESQLATHPASVESWIFAGFDAVFRWHQHSGKSDAEGDPWIAMQRFREQFPGYTCGYLGYDLKNAREQLHSGNPDAVGLPDIWMGRPTRVYRYAVKSDNTTDSKTERNAETSSEDHITEGFLNSSIPKSEYLRMVRQAQDYIREGDIYEVNLSHQLSCDFQADSLNLYRSMRKSGAVPFAAYLAVEGVEVSCASPERFLSKSGNNLLSEPIKGTRPRGSNPEEDAKIREELQNSEKDRAENLMIVDLVRNDLSRVCQSGSVKVGSLFEIQQFGTVHQLVSSVSGVIRKGVPSVEALAACFPMGSMTGAPKIRSMEIIEELENYRRGLYSGAIGFFTPDDDFSFNVVIRTAIIRDGKLYYAVGGAITSDSDPASEWDETLVKARALGLQLSGNTLDLSE